MMDETSPHHPDLHDDLVAYLDGELDEAATQKVERALTDDPTVRREVDVLTRTFDLLDELPQERVSEEFTARTLATIQVDEVRGPGVPPAWWGRVRRVAIAAGWIAGLALSAWLGVVLSEQWTADESAQLVEELPLVKNLDVYTELGDIDYLRELHKSGLFDEKQTEQP